MTETLEVGSVTRCWIKKIAQLFPKIAYIISKAVSTLFHLFQKAQKSTILSGYFCGQICCQELSKIAQSGHTGCWRHTWCLLRSMIIILALPIKFPAIALFFKHYTYSIWAVWLWGQVTRAFGCKILYFSRSNELELTHFDTTDLHVLKSGFSFHRLLQTGD